MPLPKATQHISGWACGARRQPRLVERFRTAGRTPRKFPHKPYTIRLSTATGFAVRILQNQHAWAAAATLAPPCRPALTPTKWGSNTEFYVDPAPLHGIHPSPPPLFRPSLTKWFEKIRAPPRAHADRFDENRVELHTKGEIFNFFFPSPLLHKLHELSVVQFWDAVRTGLKPRTSPCSALTAPRARCMMRHFQQYLAFTAMVGLSLRRAEHAAAQRLLPRPTLRLFELGQSGITPLLHRTGRRPASGCRGREHADSGTASRCIQLSQETSLRGACATVKAAMRGRVTLACRQPTYD